MSEIFDRTRGVIGSSGLEKLKKARVAVFGIGGVGGYVAEALARSGVGAIDLIDKDAVSPTNINRQIVALHSTVGRPKTEVMRERIADINPECNVVEHQIFYLPENADGFDLSVYDFVVDAIDTVSAKLELAVRTRDLGVPFVCCLGTGNKLDPTKLEIADISKTSVCPLARVMRRELRARGINHLTVLYSTEQPVSTTLTENGRPVPASTAFVPSAAGLILASHVVRRLIEE
jgi:tRNA A37 threonylcarbamoyladenosine dehydratase